MRTQYVKSISGSFCISNSRLIIVSSTIFYLVSKASTSQIFIYQFEFQRVSSQLAIRFIPLNWRFNPGRILLELLARFRGSFTLCEDRDKWNIKSLEIICAQKRTFRFIGKRQGEECIADGRLNASRLLISLACSFIDKCPD